MNWRPQACGLAVLAVTAMACYSSVGDDAGRQPPSAGAPASGAIDEAALVRAALTYRGPEFVRVSEIYPSSAAKSAWIRVYASKAANDAYQRINPSASGSGQRIVEGGLVVREILDQAGVVKKLTMVAQGPKGYNPASGDLWFATTDLAGNFLKDGTNALHGPLPTCSGCHAGRAADGFLFGVDSSARAKEPSDAASFDAGTLDSGVASPASEPDGAVARFDLNGMTLARDGTPPSSIPLSGISVKSGDIVVISRNANRLAFETHWRTTLPSRVNFVNAAAAWPSRALVANRTGRWELRAADGSVVDGPTPPASSLRSYERRTTSLRWFEVPETVATPGVSLIPALKSGIWLSEWSDGNGDFDMEFIELIWNE